MRQYVGQPMQVVMVVKYYRGTPWNLKGTQQFPRNTRTREAALRPFSPPSLPACAVHLLVILPSIFSDLLLPLTVSFFSILFCFSMPWHLASNCFLMSKLLKIQFHLLSLCLLAPLFLAKYLILSLVSLH